MEIIPKLSSNNLFICFTGYSVSTIFQDGINNVLSPGATGPGLPRDSMGVSNAGREGPESVPYRAKGE